MYCIVYGVLYGVGCTVQCMVYCSVYGVLYSVQCTVQCTVYFHTVLPKPMSDSVKIDFLAHANIKVPNQEKKPMKS